MTEPWTLWEAHNMKKSWRHPAIAHIATLRTLCHGPRANVVGRGSLFGKIAIRPMRLNSGVALYGHLYLDIRGIPESRSCTQREDLFRRLPSLPSPGTRGPYKFVELSASCQDITD